MPPTEGEAHRLATSGAVAILSVVKESSDRDGFRPLKLVATEALGIQGCIAQYRSTSEDWVAFGEKVVQRVAVILDRLNGHHARLSPTLLKDLETLTSQLLSINQRVGKAISVKRPKWKKLLLRNENPSLLENLKYDFREALGQFALSSQIDARSAICQQKEATPTLRLTSTAPPPPLFFYGRNEYFLNLVDLIKRGQERSCASRIIVGGPGGIGKTTIVTALLHHPDINSIFMDHTCFASCEAVESESLLLKVIASCLGIREGSNDMLSRIVSSIRQSSHPTFLVLDNFETCWFSGRRSEIHKVLKHLAALDNLTLLLTMRGRDEPPEIQWERIPELGILKLEDARKLFADISELHTMPGPSVDDKLVDALLEALDCLPLAVTLLAQLVRQGESIQTLHRRWRVQKTGLLSTGREDRHYSLDASIRLSLESAPMKADEHAARLLRVLSYLPDGIPTGTLEGLTSLFSFKEAYQASYTLRSVSLAYQDSDGTLKSLSPIRHHVASYTPLEAMELEAIQQYYIGLAGVAEKVVREEIDVQESARQLKPQIGNLHYVLAQVAKGSSVDSAAQQAILQVTKYLYIHGVPSADLLTHLLSNKNVKLSDYDIAETTYTVGMVYHISKKFDLALEAMTKATNIFTSLKTDRRLAACEWTKGDILRTQCRFSEAKEVRERCKGKYAALEAERPREANDGVAIALWGLAGIAEVRGELEDARSMLQEAQKLADPKDHSLHVICRMSLASVDMEQGNYKEAVQTLRDVLGECSITEDPHDIGQCLYRLCKGLLRLKEYDEVRVYAEEGRDIYDRSEIYANCVQCLGYVALHDKAYEEAEKLFSQALEAFKGYGDRLGVADTQLGLAELFFEQGEGARAETFLESLLVEYKAIECPRGVGKVYISLTKIHKQNSTRVAQLSDRLKEAEGIYIHLGNSTELEVCRSLMSSLKVESSVPS